MFDEARWRMDGTISTREESARCVPSWGGKSLLLYVTLDLSCNFFEAVIEICPCLIGSGLSRGVKKVTSCCDMIPGVCTVVGFN